MGSGFDNLTMVHSVLFFPSWHVNHVYTCLAASIMKLSKPDPFPPRSSWLCKVDPIFKVKNGPHLSAGPWTVLEREIKA